jgi:plasmid maintenance system antidote protein VapI
MKEIEYLIHILNISKGEFAKQTEINPGHLSKLIKGEGKLTFDQIKKINEKYNVNLNWLVAGQGNIFNQNYESEVNTVNENIIKYGVNDTNDRASLIAQIKEKDSNIIVSGVNYIGLQVIIKLLLSIEKRIFEEKLKYVEEFYKKNQEQK